MSATPTVRILAFSPPVVNGQKCSVHISFGTGHGMLEGEVALMREMASDILAATAASSRPKPPAPAKGSRRPGSGRIADPARVILMQEVLAIANGGPKHGEIAFACRNRGIKPEHFHAWRTKHLKKGSKK